MSGLGGSNMKEGKHREAGRSEVQVQTVQEDLEGSPLDVGVKPREGICTG